MRQRTSLSALVAVSAALSHAASLPFPSMKCAEGGEQRTEEGSHKKEAEDAGEVEEVVRNAHLSRLQKLTAPLNLKLANAHGAVTTLISRPPPGCGPI